MTFTNPIRVGDLPKFNEGSPLRSWRDSDSVGLQWRKGSEYGRSAVADRENMRLLMWKLNRLRLYKGTGSDGGFRWHNPKEYDPVVDYAENEWVIVSPDNPARIAGVSNDVPQEDGGAIFGVDGFGVDQDKATAGTWICVKSPKVLLPDEQQPIDEPDEPPSPRNYKVHVPAWPLPGGEATFPFNPLDPDGPDSPDNYWMLVALYPTKVTICVNGVDQPFWIHAQPVEEFYILGEEGEVITGEGGEGTGGE